MQETQVRSLGRNIPWGRKWQSRTLAWKIPWMEKPGRLESMGLQRVGHNPVTSLSLSKFPMSTSNNSANADEDGEEDDINHNIRYYYLRLHKCRALKYMFYVSFFLHLHQIMVFPGGARGKELAC